MRTENLTRCQILCSHFCVKLQVSYKHVQVQKFDRSDTIVPHHKSKQNNKSAHLTFFTFVKNKHKFWSHLWQRRHLPTTMMLKRWENIACVSMPSWAIKTARHTLQRMYLKTTIWWIQRWKRYVSIFAKRFTESRNLQAVQSLCMGNLHQSTFGKKRSATLCLLSWSHGIQERRKGTLQDQQWWIRW